MKLTPIGILILILATASLARADSLEFMVQTTDSGTPLNTTVKGTNLLDLTKHLVEQQKEFAGFLGRSYSANVKYLGVKNALQFSSNAAGTSVTLHIPKTGFTKTFNGASAQDVHNQIEDFLKGDVSSAYSTFEKSINATSKIAPLDGNPQSATAWLSSGAFSRFAFEPVAGRDAFELGDGWGFNAGFAYTSIHTDDGDVTAYDLSLTMVGRFNDRIALTLALPLAYHQVAGSDLFFVGGELGLPIYIIPPDRFSNVAIGWRVTPFASSAAAISVDLIADGVIAGGGVNSALDFHIGNKTTITVGNQIAYFTGIPLDISDYYFNTDIDEFITRNGVKVTQKLGTGGFIDAGAAYTNFLSGNTAIDGYLSPVAGVGLRFGNGNASYLRLGYHGDFADGYTSNGADILLSLSW